MISRVAGRVDHLLAHFGSRMRLAHAVTHSHMPVHALTQFTLLFACSAYALARFTLARFMLTTSHLHLLARHCSLLAARSPLLAIPAAHSLPANHAGADPYEILPQCASQISARHHARRHIHDPLLQRPQPRAASACMLEQWLHTCGAKRPRPPAASSDYL